MEFSGLKVTFILASLGVIACTNAAAIGDSLISLSYGGKFLKIVIIKRGDID